MDLKERTALLADVPLFAGLDSEPLAGLAEVITEHHYAKDAVVVTMDEGADALYLVVEGVVRVSLTADKGREFVLGNLGPGQFFGEMSLVDGEPRSANVRCEEDATLLRLGRGDFLKTLRRYPELAQNVITEMCARLRKADEAIGSLALLDVFGRIARYLTELAEQDDEAEKAEGFLIEKLPTQQEIAARTGTTRTTVSRALRTFEEQGLVARRGRGLMVCSDLARSALQRVR